MESINIMTLSQTLVDTILFAMVLYLFSKESNRNSKDLALNKTKNIWATSAWISFILSMLSYVFAVIQLFIIIWFYIMDFDNTDDVVLVPESKCGEMNVIDIETTDNKGDHPVLMTFKEYMEKRQLEQI